MPPYAGPPVAPRSGETISAVRLLVFLALSVVLILCDNRGRWLARLRQEATLLAQPVWMIAAFPGQLGQQIGDYWVTHRALVAENRSLHNQLLIANARVTRLLMAARDNAQLRDLLNVAEHRGLDVQLASIFDIDMDPTRKRLILDAGRTDGVYVGQPVIDAGGLVGQVIEVAPFHAIVLLLTDPDHAVPVMLTRNGVRLIAYGHTDYLELRDIPLSAGVNVGDEVVTSGLGGRIPAGFPVGQIVALEPDVTHAFIVGKIRPAARLDRGRDVLLLRGGESAAQKESQPGANALPASTPLPSPQSAASRTPPRSASTTEAAQ